MFTGLTGSAACRAMSVTWSGCSSEARSVASCWYHKGWLQQLGDSSSSIARVVWPTYVQLVLSSEQRLSPCGTLVYRGRSCTPSVVWPTEVYTTPTPPTVPSTIPTIPTTPGRRRVGTTTPLPGPSPDGSSRSALRARARRRGRPAAVDCSIEV